MTKIKSKAFDKYGTAEGENVEVEEIKEPLICEFCLDDSATYKLISARAVQVYLCKRCYTELKEYFKELKVSI